MRIKTKHIPEIRKNILKRQGNRCALCRIDMQFWETKDSCLDHDHKTGMIRGVLCRNCNGAEGKVFNQANRCKRDATPMWWLRKLIVYLDIHDENPSGVYHPTHKTVDEKRLLRNKRARLKRKRAKK